MLYLLSWSCILSRSVSPVPLWLEFAQPVIFDEADVSARNVNGKVVKGDLRRIVAEAWERRQARQLRAKL